MAMHIYIHIECKSQSKHLSSMFHYDSSPYESHCEEACCKKTLISLFRPRREQLFVPTSGARSNVNLLDSSRCKVPAESSKQGTFPKQPLLDFAPSVGPQVVTTGTPRVFLGLSLGFSSSSGSFRILGRWNAICIFSRIPQVSKASSKEYWAQAISIVLFLETPESAVYSYLDPSGSTYH